jgi:cell fate regulator YaaT (PSP1 superfamily)
MSCSGCSNNIIGNSQHTDVFGWINDLPDTSQQSDIVEVKFKTTRREFYQNTSNIPLKRGDMVVVATSPGHDVGEVMLTGYLAEKQFQRKIKHPDRYMLNTIYRKASLNDTEKLNIARGRERTTLIRSRQIASDLGLDMKIGDVEFRGDNNKAIFYYIAEGRVDFREMIKIYAQEFHIKIEMKQIGARQEAGLIGGIGSCGRELCCSSWRTDFSSISSEAILKQGLSSSAQKMAGACGKLKCCLLYELDFYIESQKEFPQELLFLETAKGLAKPFKTDYLKKEIWFSLSEGLPGNMIILPLKEVKNIIQQNKRGIKPDISRKPETNQNDKIQEVALDERIDRFDNINQNRNKNRNKRRKNKNQDQSGWAKN